MSPPRKRRNPGGPAGVSKDAKDVEQGQKHTASDRPWQELEANEPGRILATHWPGLDRWRPVGTVVDGVIQRHLPPEQFKVLLAAEASERDIIRRFVDRIAEARP